MFRFLFLTLTLSLCTHTPLDAQRPGVKPSPELEKLHFQLGNWTATSKTLDPSGKLISSRESHHEIVLEHGGLMLLHLVYPMGEDVPNWRIWQFYGQYDKQLHDVSFDAAGHFEERVATLNAGKLAFAFPKMRAFQDGVPRNWRKTHSKITKDSYHTTWDYTEDDGKTWTVIFETSFQRDE